MKVKELLSVLPQSTDVIIRRAFADTYEDDAASYYYKGNIKDMPEDFEYKNRPIIATYWWGKDGDQHDAKGATAIDIAIGDFDEGL